MSDRQPRDASIPPVTAPGRSDASSTSARRALQLVRAEIADRVLPALPPAQLGEVTLAPHQRQAAARLRDMLSRHRGALLADEVGLGKTYVALAVARHYSRCHVIAPAALGAMWAAARARTGSPHVTVHSLHAFSHGAPPHLPIEGATLVIIDEAHHLRHAKTARYQRVSEAIADADVLLLSATPLHNRSRDLRTLLGLFAGSRADVLSESQRGALIVRRTAQQVQESAARPMVQRHRAIRIPMETEILSRLMALPSPLPARDGAVAGALIRMGLLRAWCSSDAALLHAVRRRRLRGATLRDALRTGRHPTSAELRAWAATEAEAQLGFPELLASGEVEHGPLLEVLERHLAALDDLREALQRTVDGDAMRARVLRRILERHRGTPVVAFTQYTRTVQALYRALGDIAGVAALTGNRAEIASGAIPRWEALQLFAPRSHGRPPPPEHLAIRLLITTDILAEGVNLQDAGVVVHLDLPWTAALRDQRVGRCVRIGSAHARVHVYRLAPPRPIEHSVRFELRVLRKAALARRLIAGGPRYAPADRTTELHAVLASWSVAHDPVSRTSVHTSSCDGVPAPTIAAARAPVRAALTVVDHHGTPILLAVLPRRSRWVATTRLGSIVSLLRRLPPQASPTHVSEADLRAVRRAIRRWHRRRRSRDLAGLAPSALSELQRRLLARLAAMTEAMTVAERRRLANGLREARASVLHAVGPAAERALAYWHASSAAPDAWLRQHPTPRPPTAAVVSPDDQPPILLLSPD